MGKNGKALFRAFCGSVVVVVSLYIVGCELAPSEPDLISDPSRIEDSGQARGGVRVARVIEPRDLGMANPAGLAFSSRSGTLLVVERAPGAPAGPATDIESVTSAEDGSGTVRIAAGVADPVNMAFDGRANRLLVFESASNRLMEVLAGADGRLDPQSLQRIDARSLGLQNAQGMTVDPVSGRLFILDAAGPRIVRVDPGAQRGFASPTISVVDLAELGSSDLRGVALDPTNGHLHVLDPVRMVLRELTQTGQVVATRDLSGFGLRNPQGMAFGPSGDNTDDPSEMSLYIADSGVGAGLAEIGQITELSFALAPAAAPPMQSGSLVQKIQTWQFSPPSPDAAGITYIGSGRMLISDSEVNEMPIYAGANLFQMTPSGVLTDTYTTLSYSDEPTGITWNPANKHLFISDDTGTRKVYEVNPGPDGLYQTSDDVVTSFNTGPFGSDDPEGVTYDSSNGVLFVVDGVNAEVYRVAPGNNGVFDGVSPSGDDVVTHFDTKGFGLIDPEGIAYDSDYGHLYIIGEPTTSVFHVTTTGTVLRTIDIGAANPHKPAGLAYAPSSVNPGAMNLWIAARGTDNDSDPKENDGEVYEFSLPSFSGNALPVVTITAPAGGLTFTEGTSIGFSGTASDIEDGNLTGSLAWTSSLDGSIGTGGSFSRTLSTGTHTITASVTDSKAQQASAAVQVRVNPEGVVSLNVRVATSSDDAEQAASGSMSLASSDLELVFDGGIVQTVGMRFNGLSIPPGATITNASIQFQVDEADSEATSLTIRGQASDNAPTFTTASGNISSRSTTASSVAWSQVPAWATVGQAGPDQRTPDIASIIQEIVNRPGWSIGSSLAIIISGTGHRTAVSYNGVSSAAPLLSVDYVVGPNSAPTASDVTITGTAQVGQVLTGSYTYRDAESNPQGTSTFRWLRNTTPISGATALSYTLVPADETASIEFEVTPVAASGTSPGTPVHSAAVGPVVPGVPNAPPTASNVIITGTAEVGQVLTGSYTYNDAEGNPQGTSTYRWLRGGVAIPNATAATYTLVSADEGTQIVFEVTPVAAIGASPGTPVQSASVGPVLPAPQSSILEVRLSASSDDAEEQATGSVGITSSDLELVFDGSDQKVGMRFSSITIPRGATIKNASIQFQVDEANSEATSLTLRGQAVDNAPTFTTARSSISARSLTASSASWSPGPWMTVGQAGPDQRTPNIASVIQEIVNRPGWSNGNSLVIIINGTGHRTAESYNGVPSAAPLLHVEYAVGP